MSDFSWHHELQHARPPCPSPSPEFAQICVSESVMPSYYVILCCPVRLLSSIFLSIRIFSNESAVSIGGQSIGASASESILLMTIQGWFPLGLTGLISLLCKGLSSLLQHYNSKASILRSSDLFMVQFSHPYLTIGVTTSPLSHSESLINTLIYQQGNIMK